jgi:hypothetical protein
MTQVTTEGNARLVESSTPECRWRDRPACAGLWLEIFEGEPILLRLDELDIRSSWWKDPAFGPIPDQPKEKA